MTGEVGRARRKHGTGSVLAIIEAECRLWHWVFVSMQREMQELLDGTKRGEER